MTGRPDRRVVPRLLAAVFLLVSGTNLQGVLLPILGHERGAGMLAIGLYSASWSLGFVLACWVVGRVMGALGSLATFSILASLSGLSALLLWLCPVDAIWIGLRMVIGFCFGGLSAIVEGWLIACTGTGVAFASYLAVVLVASLAGTLSLDVLDPQGPTPFLVMGGSVLASIVPAFLARGSLPPAPMPFRVDIGRVIALSPLGALGCLGAGTITGALGGLGPVFGMMAGLGMRGTTLMLAANTLGGAVANVPVNALTDRIGRRWLLLGVTMLGVAVCVPLVVSSQWPGIGLILLLGAFGFAQYPLYGVCVGITNMQAGDRPSAQVASEMLLLFGLGTIAGPMIGGPLLHRGIGWMFGFVAMMFMAIGLGAVASRRLDRRDPR
jgi:predicted MFS family arabinose efflux permease